MRCLPHLSPRYPSIGHECSAEDRADMDVLAQSCGDVLTKKKLDSHRGQCRGASFACLDCMTHFRGTDYKAHTVRTIHYTAIWSSPLAHGSVVTDFSAFMNILLICACTVLHFRGAKVSRSIIQGEAHKSTEISDNFRIHFPRSQKSLR